MNLQELKDKLSIDATGMTKAEAVDKNICIMCKKPPTFQTLAGIREYNISGMCEQCFDKLFPEED